MRSSYLYSPAPALPAVVLQVHPRHQDGVCWPEEARGARKPHCLPQEGNSISSFPWRLSCCTWQQFAQHKRDGWSGRDAAHITAALQRVAGVGAAQRFSRMRDVSYIGAAFTSCVACPRLVSDRCSPDARDMVACGADLQLSWYVSLNTDVDALCMSSMPAASCRLLAVGNRRTILCVGLHCYTAHCVSRTIAAACEATCAAACGPQGLSHGGVLSISVELLLHW